MNDAYDNAKKAARERMMREAALQKQSFIRELKEGLGDHMVQELETVTAPPKKVSWWNKFMKVLGL
jgi:hypothetical protein